MAMRLNVPLLLQKPRFCSETSAAMVLQYFGIDETPESIHAAGCTVFENMLPCLRKHITARELHTYDMQRIKDAIDDGQPVIVRIIPRGQTERHTVVIIGYDDGNFIINDPAQGRVTVPADEIEASFVAAIICAAELHDDEVEVVRPFPPAPGYQTRIGAW